MRNGLSSSPRSLPARYFYDALGSLLFRAICRLPWYPITRAEHGLLDRHAGEMVRKVRGLDRLVELGCGSGDKVLQIAGALAPRDATYEVHLVDVSAQALELSERAGAAPARHRRQPLRDLRGRAPRRHARARGARADAGALPRFGTSAASIRPRPAPARRDPRRAPPRRRPPPRRRSRRAEADLLLAYADPLGVTAAFNKNVLLRMNTELGADFALRDWDHRAVFRASASRVEMHLVSRVQQRVRIPAAEIEVDFAAGETIWTESSYKYTPASIAALGSEAGLRREAQWIDPEAHFAMTLFLAEG